jgi:hypothetical protein
VNFRSATGSNGSLTQGLQHPGGFSLCGTLTYNNISSTVLNNTTVQLRQGANLMYQAVTDVNGYFEFINPEAGAYTLSANCTKPWGGGNAVDALLIMKHFVGAAPLTGLNLAAADVDISGYVNSSDGLKIMRRFVGAITSFTAGDWVFETKPVTVTWATDKLLMDLSGLCTGDVNGSYVPPNVMKEPTLFLENKGIQVMGNNQIVQVPVRLSQDLNCAALSLIMNYPADEIEIIGVEAAYDKEILQYNTIDGELRIAWYTLAPKNLSKDDALFTLILRLKNSGSSANLDFTLNAESSIADFQGEIFLNKSLHMPFLVNGNQGFSLGQNVPNPFSNVTQISYVIPEDGYVKLEVLDVIGQQIAILTDGLMSAGSHDVLLSGTDLPNGLYFYRMIVNTESQQYIQTRRMVISR